MATLIVVPARYGSTRFPGKPLSLILGRSMVSRVAVRARAAADILGDAHSVVATDHEDIADACERDGLDVVMTPVNCPSGSDRALAAVEALGTAPDFILNLQGDAPFVPVEHIVRVAEALRTGEADVATPYIRLGWLELDTFRAQKQTTPFSGTTILVGPGGRDLVLKIDPSGHPKRG
ncbi:MAG: NTP transferase domain-containing protein [Pseudomonadota bacterium]